MKLKQVQHSNYLYEYTNHLRKDERSFNTIAKYSRDVELFLKFVGQQELTKEVVLDFKKNLHHNYALSSANSMLAAVNGFLDWFGLPQYKVKALKTQRNLFSKPEQELTRQEYQRLINTAEERKNRKLSLLIQTICATGIRVSELAYITVESLNGGHTSVSCKGKNRIIFLPKKLCKLLKTYCKQCEITVGSIFVTRTGSPIDRSNIWKMMKRLCKEAKVEKKKVFPHNLRHLFARTYYEIKKDISRLADILGHTSINTTRIYTLETGRKHAQQLNKMNLIYCE